MAHAGQKRKRTPLTSDNIHPTPQPKHPYLAGNFAPIHRTLPLTKCTFTGRIPDELADGEYVRNGSNPVSNDDLGRDAHWFDGDGMLSGVLFKREPTTGEIEPEFVNQFVLTDLYISAKDSPRLIRPILPSIATLVNPLASFIHVTLVVLRTVLLVILSHLPGSKQAIKRISVANTNIVFHDGRALATCESGPPMRIQLPGLETVGWYNGATAEGEPKQESKGTEEDSRVLGQDSGLISFMREWTTAHPKVDPTTHEMLMFHSSFAPPYVQYSILPQSHNTPTPNPRKLLNAPVPGITSAKMMHDFGVSRTHTVIMDLPLSLDPLNSMKGLPPVSYDSSKPSRFGVFPRHEPEKVQWYETDASCIFHTANTWDDEKDVDGEVRGVNMLCCRLTSATLVFAAGNIAPPVEKKRRSPAVVEIEKKRRMPFFSSYDPEVEVEEKEPLLFPSSEEDEELEEDQCRLYYYHFSLGASGTITHQYALTSIPFEFPSTHPAKEMSAAKYIYGCSTTTSSAFGAALGKATKIDAIVKIDAQSLIARGRASPPRGVSGVVDSRSMQEVLVDQEAATGGEKGDVSVFQMPAGWFAQEPRFVPKKGVDGEGEDEGWLVFYAFDEGQLDSEGEVPGEEGVCSELWVLEARGMREVVCRVKLPQRVPYGLHGSWFGREEIEGQRGVEGVRELLPSVAHNQGLWGWVREKVEGVLG